MKRMTRKTAMKRREIDEEGKVIEDKQHQSDIKELQENHEEKK